jgi:PAS domain S-box-containing protein
MAKRKDEEEALRSVALQNAQSIFLARQRAEEELIRTKETLEVKTQELTRSLAMMRATLEATTDGILVTNGHGQVTDFNAQFVKMWQLPREILDTREHLPLLATMSQSCKEPHHFLARIDDIKAASPSQTYDLLECTDGRVFERFSRIQFVEDRNVGRVWSFRDITERRQAEAASLRLAVIVEFSNDAIISKSLDGIVTTWNTAAERIFGYRAEEMIGQPILRLLPEDRQDEEHMILERLRRGEWVDHFETVRRTKDGHLVDVSVTISPMRDERGTIIGASKIARDITEQKQLEKELAQRAAQLERLNAELQQFGYIVSHDLQEPLRTITSFVQLLAKHLHGTVDAQAAELIGFVVDGAQRMQALITDLLAYTRVSGQAQTFSAVDGERLLARVLGDLQLAIQDSAAEVTHGALPTVDGDAGQLGLVFQNLIGNALKFRSEAPPRIHIAARQEGHQWVFSVRDNGIGIDPQHAARIFQVFQRLHTRSKYPGTGIGLAICQKIIERHGGHIWVESEAGKGATFFFTLPASDAPPLDSRASQVKEKREAEPGRRPPDE